MQILALSILFVFALDSYLAIPYGFLGVRGKKSTMDTIDSSPYDTIEIDNPYRLDDEKLLLNYLVKQYGRQNYPQDSQWGDLYSYEKRVPYGFMGMRGKRSPVQDNAQGSTDDKQSNAIKQNQY